MFLSEAFGAMVMKASELGWTPRLSDTVADAIRWYRTSDAIGVDREKIALLLVVLAVTATALPPDDWLPPR